MTKIKENSTLNQNKGLAELTCPVTYVMNKIGGHWKSIIIYQMRTGPKRYSELRRAIPIITEKMLIQSLKQLEADHLVIRKAEPVVPPFVTYFLSDSGVELIPLMNAMADWAVQDNQRQLMG
ncbi:DNA-binding HxlR family transcriptional regulator [Pedobacter cryoconitis]|uniref:DNA-binding HxlR family transcriptional regulator n=1 Tax=Pedobacter cryoconitis TaxID=188932 RepID=A0A7W9DX06_9SPHI|nr:helix-turn-helix domain-containing protein [Pedobacter cryoconitis]MBB5634612.1 DNA-binding HxlR family transcriptional regulator [Pedobacter cryoconitis]MBB6272258.1 DNA-binding HxlR family transcriptional regulator [Pedobacter cryoconitis]